MSDPRESFEELCLSLQKCLKPPERKVEQRMSEWFSTNRSVSQPPKTRRMLHALRGKSEVPLPTYPIQSRVYRCTHGTFEV